MKQSSRMSVLSIWAQMGYAGLNLTEPGLRADFGTQRGMGTASALPSHLRAALGCSPLGLRERKAGGGDELGGNVAEFLNIPHLHC